MLEITLDLSLIFDTYSLRFEAWLIGQAKVIGKTLTKAEAYRACFKDFLLNNQDAAKARALGSVLTSQERRYLKQAFRALPTSPYPSASLSNEFWNYMDVEEGYENVLHKA